jgi:uncharacterized protein (DUF2126 family)
MTQAAEAASATLRRAGIGLTLGGEPTFLPVEPSGAEWSYAAVGPTKLKYARSVAEHLRNTAMQGAAVFYCPGKLYPGEVNPRWAIKLLINKDGTHLRPAHPKLKGKTGIQEFGDAICKHLGVKPHWVRFEDPKSEGSHVLAMPLDHDGSGWASAPWPIAKPLRKLLAAEGPAGLRLPLQHFPENVAKRVLTIEWRGPSPSVFFPPLLQPAFLELLAAVDLAAPSSGENPVNLEGYVPSDEAGLWTVLGLAADPGVLEVNLPACASWSEYAHWIEAVTSSCEAAGLRSWKQQGQEPPEGTGGGNHILWGGATLETNPFFTRPSWLAAILRHWQRHPSLAYIFTGCYVGPSSQAPRPDESARDLYDLEMAYRFLESLPPGDHRHLINETLRHLHTDVTGNSHRSEISFDKFWNTSWPGGALGLIEFRAVESLPRADWMSAIALLLVCLAARAVSDRKPKPLKNFGRALHDKFFLPSVLWADFASILKELEEAGFALDTAHYRAIWDWRFPCLLEWGQPNDGLVVRKALEGWPLLCETPVEGGSTSRFVDTSMQRLEFCASEDFVSRHDIYVAGRLLPLRTNTETGPIAGLRFRRSNLYPSLHPGIPPQLPLHVTLLDKRTHRVSAAFALSAKDPVFTAIPPASACPLSGTPCITRNPSDVTFDLRLAK